MSDDLDRLLERECGAAVAAIADGGFSARVIRRIGRRARVRLVVLGSAVVLGGGIALGPVLRLAGGVADLTAHLTGGWAGLDLSGHHGYLAAAVLVGLLSPLAIHMLER